MRFKLAFQSYPNESSRMIPRRIRHPRISKSVAPLAAFAATAAVQAADRADAGDGMLKRQANAERHHPDFFHAAEGQTHLDLAMHRLIDQILKAAKEGGRRIREG